MMLRITLILFATILNFLVSRAVSQDTDPQHRDAAFAGLNPPDWLKSHSFSLNEYAFVRLRYTSPRRGHIQSQDWRTDYPDADLAIAEIVKALTPLQVSQKAIDITSAELFSHPMVYLIEPGLMHLTEREIDRLRLYCKSGGLLVLDDSWGTEQHDHVQAELNRIFTGREITEIPMSHELFHCVFDFDEKPQVPSERQTIQQLKLMGIGPAEYNAVTDDNNRIMVLWCHNTDLADGWSGWNGENEAYSQDISGKLAVPMGINIIFHALTR